MPQIKLRNNRLTFEERQHADTLLERAADSEAEKEKGKTCGQLELEKMKIILDLFIKAVTQGLKEIRESK